MATHDYVIANGTGAAVRSDLNNALAAIVSNNSGTSEPATTYAYQWWADTTANVLKIRNSANNAWITLRELDGTMLIEDGSGANPGLAFASDTNSGMFGGSDVVGFTTGGTQRFKLTSTQAVFNEVSNDYDFRVESNGNTHMLFVDAGNDRVAIGNSSPEAEFHVAPSGTNARIRITNDNTGHTATDGFQLSVNASKDAFLYNWEDTNLIFGTNNSEAARIDSDGRLLVGGTSEAHSGTIVQIQHIGSPVLTFARNDSSISEGNGLGQIDFYGNDGGSFQSCAYIIAQADGTHANNDKPTRLIFGTTADGGSSPTERLRIDSSGRLLVGTSSLIDSSTASNFQIANASGPRINIARNDTSVTNGNLIGALDFYGNDSNGTYQQCARIIVEADATHNTDDKPSRLAFYTTADDASSSTERMRLNSEGQLLVGATSAGSADKVLVSGQLNAGGVRFASLAKSDSVGNTMTFDISGSNEGYVFVRIRIKVGYGGNASYQMHAQYDYATCNFGTSGSTATQTGIHQVEAGNAQFNYSDITVSRPSDRTVRVTYAPSSGSGTHSCKVMVDGSFDSIS
jgi:hypothetical protein|tara:strand:- start:1714 stop:3429 length:1716 start_codon:yes stop_codon:yes gene_type:complete